MRQLLLIQKPKIEHGGSLTHRKRKTCKPLDSKKVTHLVLKSHKNISLFKNKDFVCRTISRQAELSSVKIYDLSVQHDHIHHAIYFADRKHYNRFVRAVTGLLSRKFGRGIWKYRPYTKVVEWGRGVDNLKNYIQQNELEVQGVIAYKKRKKDS